MSEWHVRKIAKGVYGELSKVREELEEAEDAAEQNQPLMLMYELADIIGAAAGVAAKHGFTLDDLVNFSKLSSKVLHSEPKEVSMEKVEESLAKKYDEKISDYLKNKRAKTWGAFYNTNFRHIGR